MTNKEAATIVKRIRYYMEGSECWTDAEFIAMDMAVKALSMPSAQPETLTDKEQRIFLTAMGREENLCKQIDYECRKPYEDSLVRICHEIIRKVKSALWT